MSTSTVVPKPPLGIMPETIWIEQRIWSLIGALVRCKESYDLNWTEPSDKLFTELHRRLDELSMARLRRDKERRQSQVPF